MVRRTTWILLGVLAFVAIGYAAWRRTAAPTPEAEPTTTAGNLWNLSADQVDSVRLVDQTDRGLLVVQRDPQSGWRVLAPRTGEADAGRIEFTLAWLLAPAIPESLEA